MQKSLIKKRFSKSLTTYCDNAVVQRKMAKELVSMLEKKNYENILELGCGTGFVTAELVNGVKFEHYDAVDMVLECESYLKKISPQVNFICCDIEDFYPDKTYDLIISNASLQWVGELSEFMEKIKPVLKSGGSFVFTLFGEDNFKEMAQFVTNPLKYYSVSELKEMFHDYKIDIIMETTEILEFETPKDVLKHIKNTGVNALSDTRWTKSDLINFEEKYPINANGKYSLTYQPIYIKLEI